GLVSCSFTLNWSQEDLPCPDGKCNTGYSCLGDVCISQHSVAKGETCTDDMQCSDSLRCVQFLCQTSCSSFYTADTACDSGEFCKPFSGPNNSQIGACVASECSGTCSGSNTCIEMSSSAGACLPGCEVTFSSNTYHDNCGAVGAVRACQPIGAV